MTLFMVVEVDGESVGFYSSEEKAMSVKVSRDAAYVRLYESLPPEPGASPCEVTVVPVEVESIEVCDVKCGDAIRVDRCLMTGDDRYFAASMTGIRAEAWFDRGAASVEVRRYAVDDSPDASESVLYELRVKPPQFRWSEV